jgi:hypothetical protein
MIETVEKRARSCKQTKSLNRTKNFIPPTCTTFNNFGTVRNKVGNLAGYTDEKYFSSGHRKPFATFGLPKGKVL